MSRVAAVFLTLLASGVSMVACGRADRGSSTRSPGAIASRGRPVPPPLTAGRYLNDGDHDQAGDSDDDNAADNDRDPSYDYKADENAAYHDADDRLAVTFGHAASPADRHAIAAAVKRYYAALARDDYSAACGMLPAALIRYIPIALGREGPPYLRGVKTCKGALTRLVRRHRRELSAPVTVTEVRVEGNDAYALLGSRRMPASYVTPRREHGAWGVAQLLGAALP